MTRHKFEDGDRVTIVARTAAGERYEIEAEYSGVITDGETAHLEYYLDREDCCTADLPLDEVLEIRLREPVSDSERYDMPDSIRISKYITEDPDPP